MLWSTDNVLLMLMMEEKLLYLISSQPQLTKSNGSRKQRKSLRLMKTRTVHSSLELTITSQIELQTMNHVKLLGLPLVTNVKTCISYLSSRKRTRWIRRLTKLNLRKLKKSWLSSQTFWKRIPRQPRRSTKWISDLCKTTLRECDEPEKSERERKWWLREAINQGKVSRRLITVKRMVP